MRTGNPALGEGIQEDIFRERVAPGQGMTIQGTANKTFLLLGLAIFSASWVWSDPYFRWTSLYIIAVIVGAIIAVVTIYNKKWSPVTAPIYALVEGVLLGGVSASFERSYPGIAMQAVGLTFGTLFALLAAYKSGFINVTHKFRLGIIVATGGIAIFYILTMILGFFNIRVPLVFESGPVGIAFSFFVVVIAALNLVLDFDLIERGAESNAPKYMEWYGAFALMVTLVWLYLEILRLIAKMRSNNR